MCKWIAGYISTPPLGIGMPRHISGIDGFVILVMGLFADGTGMKAHRSLVAAIEIAKALPPPPPRPSRIRPMDQ